MLRDCLIISQNIWIDGTGEFCEIVCANLHSCPNITQTVASDSIWGVTNSSHIVSTDVMISLGETTEDLPN